MKKAKIIGAGLSGITAAIILKSKGYDVEIFETRNHIGGNCYDSPIYNTFFHVYGPHIFHTDDEEVFSFLSRYTEWMDFKLQPIGDTRLGLISLPYSQKTIKELGRELSQEEIIEYLFKDYSEKQWGTPINELPQSIINRIPRTKDCENPTWFEGQKYQCVPRLGYTNMMTNMLEGIKVHLGCENHEWKKLSADLTIFTGKIDEYFSFALGRLGYRSLSFVHSTSDSLMNTFIINSNRSDQGWTRTYDHGFFSKGHNGPTIVTKEFPIEHTPNNIPFYPIPFGYDQQLYQKYKSLADEERNVIFLGRLATYKYLDMWMAIKQVLVRLENSI